MVLKPFPDSDALSFSLPDFRNEVPAGSREQPNRFEPDSLPVEDAFPTVRLVHLDVSRLQGQQPVQKLQMGEQPGLSAKACNAACSFLFW